MSGTRDLDEKAREETHVVALSDAGMAMDVEEIPEGAREDGQEGTAAEPD
jgi:hypothetical protein